MIHVASSTGMKYAISARLSQRGEPWAACPWGAPMAAINREKVDTETNQRAARIAAKIKSRQPARNPRSLKKAKRSVDEGASAVGFSSSIFPPNKYTDSGTLAEKVGPAQGTKGTLLVSTSRRPGN